MRLQSKLLLSITPLLILPFALLLMLGQQWQRTLYQDQAMTPVRHALDGVYMEIAQQLEGDQQALDWLAHYEQSAQALTTPWLQQLVQGNPAYLAVAIFDLNQAQEPQVVGREVSPPTLDAAFWQNVRQGFVAEAADNFRIQVLANGEPVIVRWVPLAAQRYLVLVRSTQTFDAILEQPYLPGLSYMFVLSSQGDVLAKSDKYAGPAQLDSMLQLQQVLTNTADSHDFLGQPSRLLGRSLADLSVFVVLPTDESAWATDVGDLGVWVTAFTTSLLGIFALLLVVVWYLKRPLLQIQRALEAVSDGRLNTRLTLQQDDEVGRVAQHFNRMVVVLERERKAFSNADELKDEFLSNTTHELRTPLHGIIGITESLLSGVAGNLPNPVLFNLRLIISSGKRLLRLIDDILDFSRLQHGELVLQKQVVALHEQVQAVFHIFQPVIANKPLKLVSQLDLQAQWVEVDPDRLQQMLYNLIGNAVKYTERGQVTISSEMQGRMVAISVIDTGAGIAAEEQQYVFESFARGRMAGQAGSGTGLGLSITRQLVELHGGKIWIESEPGQGTKIGFTLPVASAAPMPQANPLPSVPHAADVRVHSLQDIVPVMSDKQEHTILAVDDEMVNLQVLINHLTQHGFRVVEAQDGVEALSLLQEGLKPDLIILDIMMPKMSGLEVCRAIRTIHSPNQLPIILLTAAAKDLQEGLESGANDYLTKPVAKHELLARVRTLIELKQAHNQLEDQNQQLEEKVTTRTKALEEARRETDTLNKQLRTLISTDSMTGLGNRSAFEAFISDAWFKTQQANESVSILRIEVDDFYRFLREVGRMRADGDLHDLAAALKVSVKGYKNTLLARLDGGSFIVALVNYGHSAAKQLASQMRAHIQTSTPHTLSIGVATVHPKPQQSYHVGVEKAEFALQQCMQAGGNIVAEA